MDEDIYPEYAETKAARQSIVGEAMERAHKALVQTDKTAHMLEEKLGLSLRPKNPSPSETDGGELDNPPRSRLTTEIDELAFKIHRLDLFLAGVMDRVEL